MTAGMGRDYVQVIRNCAYFKVPKSMEDRFIVDKELFQKGYFETIVSPLKRLEQNYPPKVLMGQ